MICLKDYNVAQIFLMIGISLIFQSLIIIGAPFDENYHNKMSLFNEAMVSCYLYALIGLTDY
jgi:hypothetical protein